MSSRRQISIPLGGCYRQVSLYIDISYINTDEWCVLVLTHQRSSGAYIRQKTRVPSVQIMAWFLFRNEPLSESIPVCSELDSYGEVKACRLLAPTQELNQWRLLISEVLWHSPESNFKLSAQATILYNEFENYTFEITATYFRGQRIKRYGCVIITHVLMTWWQLAMYTVCWIFA